MQGRPHVGPDVPGIPIVDVGRHVAASLTLPIWYMLDGRLEPA